MKPHIFSIAATLLGDCTGVLDWEIRIKFSCFAIFPSVRLSRWLRRCRACENGRSHRLSRTDRKIAKPLNLTRIFSVWTCSAITYLCWHSRGRHLIINLLHHTNETQNGRNSCPRLQPYFVDFRRVCVSQSQFFHVVSALQTLFCIFLSQFQDNYHGMGLIHSCPQSSLFLSPSWVWWTRNNPAFNIHSDVSESLGLRLKLYLGRTWTFSFSTQGLVTRVTWK